MKKDKEKYNAIEKALKVLSFFANDNTPIGTLSISESLDLNKATASRILVTLRKNGFLKQDEVTKTYCLGPMVNKLWQATTKDLEGQRIIVAQPYCDSLRDELSETVHFEVLSGNYMFLAYSARCSNPVSVSISVGDRVFPHTHVGAKCVAAYSHPRLAQKWLENTLSDKKKIEELLAEYRQISLRGYSIDNGVFDKNIFAIAVPVFNQNSRAVASIVSLTPYIRKESLMRKEAIEKMKETARKITEDLMCPESYDDICRIYA